MGLPCTPGKAKPRTLAMVRKRRFPFFMKRCPEISQALLIGIGCGEGAGTGSGVGAGTESVFTRSVSIAFNCVLVNPLIVIEYVIVMSFFLKTLVGECP